jgi:hypothetical protein
MQNEKVMSLNKVVELITWAIFKVPCESLGEYNIFDAALVRSYKVY